ncbi:hypothetical protein PR202_ga30545 [Eleusine coracana subsp. coracana]|uniref:Auxin efflux carrier family protein n=1 Tax=Eleusine coracana subsp. coracana TaxID=191504 RepID=A0AAV5DNN7_ELECO|nr:hypothetical protein PR202_ga30511 [Eleusine coracana subsp. coracana]GJN12279.1 hypothetical protein PR202_ga30545 [Eleusine coracana subsp. coracana]
MAGFLSLLAVSSMPVAQLLLIGVAGAYLTTVRCNVLTTHRPRRHQPGRLRRLHACAHALQPCQHRHAPGRHFLVLPRPRTNCLWFMPVNIGIAFLIGGSLGWLAVLILRPPLHLRGLIVASCSAANFGNLLLVVIPAVCGQDGNPFRMAKAICANRGLSYASFSMAIGGVYIWTYTHSVMKRSGEIQLLLREENTGTVTCVIDPNSSVTSEDNKETSKTDNEDQISMSVKTAEEEQVQLIPLLAESTNHRQSAVLGLVIGVVPWLRSVFVGITAPLRPVYDSLKLLGDGTIPCLMLILGGNLTKGVRKSKVPPSVVAAIIFVRYVVLPLIGVGIVRAARDWGFLPPDPLYLYTLMMHFAVPPAMSIGTMAQLYDVGQEECSVILLWTYLIAALALTIWSTVFMWILQLP